MAFIEAVKIVTEEKANKKEKDVKEKKATTTANSNKAQKQQAAQPTTSEKDLTAKLKNLKEEADKKAPASEKVNEDPQVSQDNSVKTEKSAKASTEAKKEKKAIKSEDENLITLKELVSFTEMDPKEARRILRKSLKRAEGERWAWQKDSPELMKVKELLGLKPEVKAEEVKTKEVKKSK